MATEQKTITEKELLALIEKTRKFLTQFRKYDLLLRTENANVIRDDTRELFNLTKGLIDEAHEAGIIDKNILEQRRNWIGDQIAIETHEPGSQNNESCIRNHYSATIHNPNSLSQTSLRGNQPILKVNGHSHSFFRHCEEMVKHIQNRAKAEFATAQHPKVTVNPPYGLSSQQWTPPKVVIGT